MRNIIYIIILLLFAIILSFLYFNNKLELLNTNSLYDLNNSFNKTQFNKDVRNFESNVKNLEKLHLNRSVLFDDNKSNSINIHKVNFDKNIIKNIDLYFDINKNKVSQEFSPKHNVKPVLYVGIKEYDFNNINIGDTFVLPFVGHSNDEMIVKQKIINKDRSITIIGDIKDYDSGIAVFTKSEDNIYLSGSFTTSSGSFDLDSKNLKGYVYDINDIDKAYIDPTINDALSIPSYD